MRNYNGDVAVYYCPKCGDEMEKAQFMAYGLCPICAGRHGWRTFRAFKPRYATDEQAKRAHQLCEKKERA